MADLFDMAGCGIYAQPLRDAAAQFNITDSGDVARWLAQLSVESGGFKKLSENLNYRSDVLLRVCNGRNGVSDINVAASIVMRGLPAIGEALYGGAWGSQHLGNTEDGDGYKFRGRGFIQITGRANYHACSMGVYGDDRLLDTPELLTLGAGAALSAAWFWDDHHLNGVTDVEVVSRKINGGHEGLAERVAMTDRLLALV